VLTLKIKSNNAVGLAGIVVLLTVASIPLTGAGQEIKQEISNALNAGDTTLAIELLNKEISLDPSYAYNYYTLGQIFYNQKKYELAEEQFRISCEKDKKFFTGVYSLGMVQLKLGKYDEAQKNFSYGLKKSKDMKADFHNAMGLYYMTVGKYQDADSEYRKAIIIDSTRAEYHINLGDDNFYMQVYPLAIAEYEKALALDTASLDVYFHWAEACLELKDYTCALEKLSIVLKKDSTYAEAWMRAGGIYYKAARSARNSTEAGDLYKKTIGAYNKYLELSHQKPDSANGRAFYEAAMSYLILGFYPEARDGFAAVLSIPVEPKDIYFYYAWAYQGMEEYDSALTYYKKHIDWVKGQGENYVSGIQNVELYRRMGECYESLKDRNNTIRYYTKSLEYDSTQAKLLYGVAVAYNYNGDYRNALIYYMKRIALGLDERYWSIYFNAATTALYLAEKGSQATAEEEDLGIENDLPAEPKNDPLANVNFAALAAEYLEKVTGEYWDKVMENDKNTGTAIKALNMLGSIYLYQLSDCPKGVKNFERTLELDPANCDAMKSIGYAYFGGLCPSDYTKALTYLQKALNCALARGSKKCDEADLLLWIAQTYQFRAIAKAEAKQESESQKDYKLAHDTYKECLQCAPGNKSCIEGEQQTRFMY
jgi:tetratricopeptide (TPR) repeat protein